MRLPCTPQWTEVDSEVCAFLSTRDPNFDAEEQLANLEMREDIDELWLQNARQEAARMVEGENADDHLSMSHTRVTAAFVFGVTQNAQDVPANSDLPAPVNISGLLPPPRPSPEDSPADSVSPAPLDTIEEEPAVSEESVETLARRIEGMATTEGTKVEKKSKTKKRNTQRKKAKARANEAAKAKTLADDGESNHKNVMMDE